MPKHPPHSAPLWMDVVTCIYCGRTETTWSPQGCPARTAEPVRRGRPKRTEKAPAPVRSKSIEAANLLRGWVDIRPTDA